MDFENFDKLTRIKVVCSGIFENPKDVAKVKELQGLIIEASPTIVKAAQMIVLSVFFPVIKTISDSKTSLKMGEKQQIVDTLKSVFDKIRVDKLPIFFNFYGFLLFEIYDHHNHRILDISEEYKLSIVECVTSLSKSLAHSILELLYVKDNAPKLCQMIYVLLELAKNEQYRTLRISAINCILAIAHVLDDNDFNDLVTRNRVAEVFLFFLPGVASQLKNVALIDEKFGHKIPSVALKAWGRMVTLLMYDYNAFDHRITFDNINNNEQTTLNKKWKDENELKQYIKDAQRSPSWYRENDNKLQKLITEFSKLTHHSHRQVRLELANMASMLIDNCSHTMPTSTGRLIDIVIILSEDSDGTVAEKSRAILQSLSTRLGSSDFKALLDNLEEGMYNVIASIPRKFNGIDERVQIVALNSLIGYITLFGNHNLTNVLHSTVHLNKLILTLIHVAEFDRSGVSLLEEYIPSDYELHQDHRTLWKKFRLFKEESILAKIETVCHVLAKFGASSIISDSLLDVIASDPEHRLEAIFLLNEIVAGIEIDNNLDIIKNIIGTYTDPNNWYLPLSVMIDEDGHEWSLGEAQCNLIQACLLVEGIGKIALVAKDKFQQFMLKTLYLVLERAGSAHPLIRAAGSQALANISKACNCSNITELITSNIDYFSFHIQRKLAKASNSTGGLNVLAVVIRYSNQQVIASTCDIIGELLMQAREDRINLNDYLQVFRMFIQSLHRWLELSPIDVAFKTKQQKVDEFEHFKVSNLDPVCADYSDGIMGGKTAEEMYKEDLEKNNLEEELDPPEYKKPEPPIHIRLAVSILSKTLHYLPSKDQTRKLLVLEILKTGLPVIKDWEDELLPLIHQIWSPLVDRFKETGAPVIVNYSFQLLVVLAKLSKDFIRSRTAKEVLPHILAILEKLVRESYLKDKGSAYRYTQSYKLQLALLQQMALVIADLDMLQSDVDKAVDVVFKYLSDKQPIPLQEAAFGFCGTLYNYDPKPVGAKIKSLLDKASSLTEYEKNSDKLINLLNSNE